MNQDELKRVLSLIIRRSPDYLSNIRDSVSDEQLEQLRIAGLIHIGNTFKSETFCITQLGIDYYKDAFGYFSYLSNKLKNLYYILWTQRNTTSSTQSETK